MMNFGWEESNRYSSWNQISHSSLFPLTHPTRYEPLAIRTRFETTSVVNSTDFMSLELPTESLILHKQRPLDLQLSADEFIYHVEKLQKNGKGPVDFSLSRSSYSNAEDLKLSLSIGGGSNRYVLAKQHFYSNHHVIDLEEDTATTFSRTKTYCSSYNVIDLEAPIHRTTGQAKSGPFIYSAFMENGPKVKNESQDFAITEPLLPTGGKKFPSLDIVESNSLQGNRECCRDQAYSNEGIKDSLFDLNKAFEDGSSCCSEDYALSYPSRESSEGSCHKQNHCIENDTCPASNKTPSALKQDKTAKLVLLDLNQNGVEEDIRTPNSDNNSANCSVLTYASPGSIHSNDLYNVREKSSSVDILDREAAESLIHISIANSSYDQDCNTKTKSKENPTKEKEKPEYSFDSFELNTLNLTETNLNDGSVSSKPLEVENEAKDFGAKLRRGRRMKDFQKEILPSLASLSRHEILEDITIMEGALRSREYRKNRGKMIAFEDKWPTPLRSRRSRVNYGRRLDYS